MFSNLHSPSALADGQNNYDEMPNRFNGLKTFPQF
jgi:hypothetical protein